jgi:4'-phosphopantetheinyl transferase
VLRLLSDQVAQVWVASPQEVLTREDGQGWLSEEEISRADRFRHEADRLRFTASRIWLRSLLSQYTGLLPQAIEFAYSDHGKPSLRAQANQQPIHFNLSHSHDRIAIAMIRNRRIGIDLEWIHPLTDLEMLIQHAFSLAEQELFFSSHPKNQPSLFFHGWTQKEAYLKATGLGLSGSLPQVKTSLAERCLNWDASTQTVWLTQSLRVDPDYAAAIAVEGKEVEVELMKWDPIL